jgi:hypothetical protein
VFEEADAYDTVVCAFVEGDGGGAEIGALREGGGCACGVEELVDTGYAYRLASPLHTVPTTATLYGAAWSLNSCFEMYWNLLEWITFGWFVGNGAGMFGRPPEAMTTCLVRLVSVCPVRLLRDTTVKEVISPDADFSGITLATSWLYDTTSSNHAAHHDM